MASDKIDLDQIAIIVEKIRIVVAETKDSTDRIDKRKHRVGAQMSRILENQWMVIGDK